MKNGMLVADCDMHVFEPPDLWQRYIDPAYRHAAPVGLTEMRRDVRVKVKSHVILRMGPVRPVDPGSGGAWKPIHDRAYADAEASGWDPASQLRAMDAEGIDIAVLFPTRGLFVLGLDTPQQMGPDGLEPDFAAAIARAYNDWMRDFCRADPARMVGCGMIAPHDVDQAVAETRRCVRELGFRAVFLSPGTVNRKPWHHPDYDRLWAECERLDVPICFHGGGQNFLRPDFSLEVLDKLMMWHTFSQPLGIMATLVSLTAGGVFERFPALRAGLLEGNCSWAPWLLYRLDEHHEWVGALEAPELRLKPSQYFRRNCFLAVEADEETVGQYVATFGDDNLVYSTDYPHADSKFPHAVDALTRLPLSPASQKRILWDNFSRLYAIAAPVGTATTTADPGERESVSAIPGVARFSRGFEMEAAMRIVDADGHVAEGATLALEAMKRWPQHITLRMDGRPSLVIEGRHYPEDTGPGAGCPPEHGLSVAQGIDWSTAAGMLRDADRDHIDVMVLYPSFGLCAPSIEDPAFAAGFCRFYNQWIADYCRDSGGRLRGVAVTPLEHGAVAVDIMREAKRLALVATMIPPALKTRNLDHPDLDPFYAAAAELDMPLGVHGAPGIHLPKIGVDRFTNYIQVHCISFPFDQMTAMTAMVSGGVFDRHPRLRVAFLEAGVGWVPFFIDRLHEHYEKRGDWIANGWQRDPHEYVKAGNIFVSCEPEEPILPGVIDVLGDAFIMFASDYPHWDGSWPESTRHLRTRPDISEASRRRIGGANAARFYGLS